MANGLAVLTHHSEPMTTLRARPSPNTPSQFLSIQYLRALAASLLDRARRIDRSLPADEDAIERTIQQYADETGWTKPLVIKWLDSPTEVHQHLSGLGLDALLDMDAATFWRRCEPSVTADEELFDRCWSAKLEADRLLDVREAERALMAPKLLAKSRAMSNNLSPEEGFQDKAISAQIGC